MKLGVSEESPLLGSSSATNATEKLVEKIGLQNKNNLSSFWKRVALCSMLVIAGNVTPPV